MGTSILQVRMSLFYQQAVYEYVLAAKIAMTDAFKEISKFVVDHGPYIGHYCSEQSLKVRLKFRINYLSNLFM